MLPAQTITDADNAYIAPIANTPAHAESLLHSLEKAAGSIGLHVNADKTGKCVLIKIQKRYIHAKGGSLKRVDEFTYLGSSVLSIENDINTRLAKTLTAIYWLPVI